MNVGEFREFLSASSSDSLVFRFSSGTQIPPHFHITEIGKVSKDFIDCGGTRRQSESCVLQTLVGEDVEHRIQSGKLEGIFGLAGELGLTNDMPVEAEVQGETIGVFSIVSATHEAGSLIFELAAKQTACLAPDNCGIKIEAPALPLANSGDC